MREMWASPDISTHLKSGLRTISDMPLHAVNLEPNEVTAFFLCLSEGRPTASTYRHGFDGKPSPLSWMVDDAQENPILSFLPWLGVWYGVVRTGRSDVLGTRDVRNDFDPPLAASNVFRLHPGQCA